MRLKTLIVLIHVVTPAVAQEIDTSAIPKEYERFQGEWEVATSQTDQESAEKLPDVFVKVAGTQFEISGSGVAKDRQRPLEFRVPATKKDNPYRSLKERGAKNLDDIVDVENQIVVFWFVGIYKWDDEELHLALMYCGQGVEGIYFRDFRPPSSFSKEPMDGEVRVVLKRRKE